MCMINDLEFKGCIRKHLNSVLYISFTIHFMFCFILNPNENNIILFVHIKSIFYLKVSYYFLIYKKLLLIFIR